MQDGLRAVLQNKVRALSTRVKSQQVRARTSQHCLALGTQYDSIASNTRGPWTSTFCTLQASLKAQTDASAGKDTSIKELSEIIAVLCRYVLRQSFSVLLAFPYVHIPLISTHADALPLLVLFDFPEDHPSRSNKRRL
jgi:hypothetical protein